MLPLTIIVNQKIGEWRDRVEKEIESAEKWVNQIIIQTYEQSKIKAENCGICGCTDRKREQHHVAGRKHDYRIITVCTECHDELTRRQKLWDARWWKENQPDNVKQAFLIQGIHDILELRAKKTGDSNYAKLAAYFVNYISALRREQR